jgi:hypothetical protein
MGHPLPLNHFRVIRSPHDRWEQYRYLLVYSKSGEL